jgi:hypothetical protein
MHFKRPIHTFLTLAIFLAAQALVSVHAAEFGSGEHKHHDHTCDIYLFAEYAKSTSLPAVPVLPVPVLVAVTLPHAFTISLASDSYRPAYPRAPPSLLS